MAEYIEREAAKRAIVEVVDSGMATTSEDLAEVIDEIPAAKWRWIPVEEALPAGSDGRSLCDNVIACTVEGEVCRGWLKGDTWHLLVGLDDRITRHGRGYVTHWMPLPEPPGELPDICAACRHYEGRSGTCRNGDSIFRYEFVEADGCCSKWEGEKQ